MSAATTGPAPPVATQMAPPPSYPASSTASASVAASVEEEDDLYGRLKSLQRYMEFVEIQEEYVKDEQKNLKRELLRAQEEVKRIQSVPLVIGQFMEMVDGNNGIVGSTTGSNYYVRILSTINRELLKPSASVALHRHSNALVDVLPPEADSSISLLGSSEKPNVTYNVSLSLNCRIRMKPLVNLTSYYVSDDESLGRYFVIPNHMCLLVYTSVRLDPRSFYVSICCRVLLLHWSSSTYLSMLLIAVGVKLHIWVSNRRRFGTPNADFVKIGFQTFDT